ncbi:unnamed protein product, partial [Iphiclides podalirius]
MAQNGSLDERTFRVYEDDESTNQTIATPRRRKYVNAYKNDNVDVLENSDTELEQGNNDEVETINMVQQVHESRGSDEEWLEEDWTTQVDSYEPKLKEMDTTQNVSCEESQMPHASQEIVIENKDQDPQNANEQDRTP